MHAHLDERNMLTIVVSNYHDGEYPFDRMIRPTSHCLYLWETYPGSEVIDMLRQDGWTDHQVHDLFTRYLHRMLDDKEVWPMELDEGMTIYRLWGQPETIAADVSVYMAALEADVRAGGPGADDGTYDYFPGAVEACAQIAEGFREVNAPYADVVVRRYNLLVQSARETHYAGNTEAEDLLPFMEEEVKA